MVTADSTPSIVTGTSIPDRATIIGDRRSSTAAGRSLDARVPSIDGAAPRNTARATSPDVNRPTRSRSCSIPSGRNRPGSGSAVHCASTWSRSFGCVRSRSCDASINPDEPSRADASPHARHNASDPGTCRYTPLTVTGSAPVPGTANGTRAPTETPSRRATVSDSTTWSSPDAHTPCVNSANRCGPSTANGTTDIPDSTAPAVRGTSTCIGTDPCNTASIRAGTPGNARRNATRTRSSAAVSAPSTYRPDTETDTRGSAANRCRIPCVTELPVNAVNAVSTATATSTVTAAAPSTTPCCPARRTPADEPHPPEPMSPAALPSPHTYGLDQS
ncbi:hypothetical protein ACIQBJ_34975 [Kitasatospora sp. NPDC088391]|uniref:hypothetical protein n=1 Tax=Kitasatospora sp. NPDC088391 TaxID=3364074 RepID=UPI00381E2630